MAVALMDDGAAARDDDLGEVVVQGHAVVVDCQRRVTVDDERRQAR